MSSPSDTHPESIVRAPETVSLPVWLYDRMARAYYGSPTPFSTPVPPETLQEGTRGGPDAEGTMGVFDMSEFEGIGDVPPSWKPIGVSRGKAVADGSSEAKRQS